MTITVDVNTILAAPRLLLAEDDGGHNCRRGEGSKDKGTRRREGGRNCKQQEKTTQMKSGKQTGLAKRTHPSFSTRACPS
jgi:hypothetical protein